MAEVDPLVSTDEEVEVDPETAAAINRALREAYEGKLIPADEVRKLLTKWKEEFSTPFIPRSAYTTVPILKHG